jgi:hypothetical protein
MINGGNGGRRRGFALGTYGGPVVALVLAAAMVTGCVDEPGSAQATAARVPPPTGAAGSPAPGARAAAPSKVRPKDAPRAPGGEGMTPAWPNLATAGVPAGKRLSNSGPLRVRKEGTVIDGKLVRQEISVEADNVTIRNTHLIGAGEWGIIQRSGHSGLRVERSEINGDGSTKVQVGILNHGGALTVRDTHVHTVTDGINTDHGLIENNVITNLKYFPGDHNDGIASGSGPASGLSLVIRRNVIQNPLGQTSAVALFQDFGRAHDVTVERNLMAGGGYALYGGQGRFGVSSNIRIIGNVFSRRHHKNGGYYGPVTAFDPAGPGNVWSGNTWAENGKVVKP